VIRRFAQALVAVLAFLILVAEVQRLEGNEAPTDFRTTTQRG